MLSNSLCSFSASRDNFATFQAGGILSIWSSKESVSKLISSTVLPNHLQSVCSCFAWSPEKGLDILTYGSSSGSVFTFNASSGSVFGLQEHGHTGAVSSISWNHLGTQVFSAADDGFLIEWNAKTGEALKRWRCPNADGLVRRGYTSLAYHSYQKLVAARQQIDVWDLNLGCIVHSFIGHSSEVTSLLPVGCEDKTKSGYILSLAKNDRIMYAWRMSPVESQANDQNTPSASFLLPDIGISVKASYDIDSHTAHIFVLLSNGLIAAYRHILNGKKILEPIRHHSLIEVTASNFNNRRAPIIAISNVHNKDILSIAYGEISAPQFESFDMRNHWSEKNIKINREILLSKSPKVSDDINAVKVGKFHVATAIPAGRKRTIGETLENSCKEISASSVLAQGLLSRDSRLLDSVLGNAGADVVSKKNSENPKHIENAVETLDNNLLLTLLDELTHRLATGHPAASQIAARWLSVLLRFRGSRLVATNTPGNKNTNSAVSNKLVHLRETLLARTIDSSRVLQLRGRLRMLREMASPGNSTVVASRDSVNAVNGVKNDKPRLPFILPAADVSSEEEDDESESGSDSDSAMQDIAKYRKNGKQTASDGSDVDLASLGDDEDLPDGEREGRLGESEVSEGEDDAAPIDEFDEGECYNLEEDFDEPESRKSAKVKLNGKAPTKYREQVLKADVPSKKDRKK